MVSSDDRLQEIFRSVFELSDGADVLTCAKSNTASWDSMAHVNLIVAIESEFDLAIDVADSLSITSYQLARQYLATVGV